MKGRKKIEFFLLCFSSFSSCTCQNDSCHFSPVTVRDIILGRRGPISLKTQEDTSSHSNLKSVPVLAIHGENEVSALNHIIL